MTYYLTSSFSPTIWSKANTSNTAYTQFPSLLIENMTMKNLIKQFSLLLLLPAVFFVSASQADTVSEITKVIHDDNAYVKENLRSPKGTIPSDGSHQFWSSGGLLNFVPADAPDAEFDAFGITPKHIEVITLEEGKSAVAMYYSEGAFHPKGSEMVNHYLTRVTEVYVKEDGKWKVRASHYSPVTGGAGTSQTSID